MSTDLKTSQVDDSKFMSKKSVKCSAEISSNATAQPFDLTALMDSVRPRGNAVVKCTQIRTRLGMMTACATEQGVCILEFDDSGRVERQIQRFRRLTAASFVTGRNAHLSLLSQELSAYLLGRLTEFSVALDLQGTVFQCAVWNALLALPYGAQINYSELADAAGRPDAVRAAGAANGANPLSIIVPCHRVLGRGGSLTGYGGGVERKAWLLECESQAIHRV